MNYRIDKVAIDPHFPFSIFCGSGFSVEDYKNSRADLHRHFCLEINYCLHGTGWYEIGDQTYPIETGDLFVINDLEYHRAINESGDMQLLVVVFNADFLLSDSEDYALIRAFYEWKAGFKNRIAADSQIVSEVAGLMLELDREWQQKEVGYRMVVKALLLKLLAILYRGFERTEGFAESVRSFQNGYVRLAPAIALIDNGFRENLTLDQLAESVHMNRNYFSTVFPQVMGCTVSEYIIRRRLRNAVQLLAGTENSVISIALDSGFQNVSYFSRTFRKQFGVSPGRYREQLRATDSPCDG